MSAVLIAAVTAAMNTLAPAERLANLPAYPGWEETAEERRGRYAEIAEAAYKVAFDPAERPVYSGKNGRRRTMSLLIGLAWMESGFARDVDIGPCYRGVNGKNPRCDDSRSACLMQIQIGQGTTHEGWTQADLFADREKCFRAGLNLVRRSFTACGPKHGYSHALDAYAVGSCGSLVGLAKGEARLAAGRRVYDLAFKTLTEPDTALLVPVGHVMANR